MIFTIPSSQCRESANADRFQEGKGHLRQSCQILLIGHAVGTIAFVVPIIIVSWLLALMSEEVAAPGVLIASILLSLILLPLILVGQAFIFALIYRLGFWIYQMFRPVQIEVIE